MNERIRELLKQAGGIQHDEDGDELTAILVGKDLAKFAELIVRKCLDIGANHKAYALMGEIMEYFGVEE